MIKVKQYVLTGKMWQNAEGKWCKRCSSCRREIVGKDGSVTTKFNVSNSITKGKVCHSCIKVGKPTWASLHKEEMGRSISGDNHPFYGRKHTYEFKRWQSNRLTGRKLSEETKEKLHYSNAAAWKVPSVRRKYNEALSKTKWLKVRSDVGQMELLSKWNRMGFDFVPNYQINIGEDLFYVDGYDVKHNVVLEFDSAYHNRPYQSTKDLERQNKIIKMLNPKRFWRYNPKRQLFIECMTNTMVINRG